MTTLGQEEGGKSRGWYSYTLLPPDPFLAAQTRCQLLHFLPEAGTVVSKDSMPSLLAGYEVGLNHALWNLLYFFLSKAFPPDC